MSEVENIPLYKVMVGDIETIHERKVKDWHVEVGDNNNLVAIYFQYFDKDKDGNDCIKYVI